jgi:N-acylneuraminate cytidylyltransferase
MSLTALIAVRKGSKRVKNKNIKNFYNTSLLDIKLKQATECKQFDEIIVSSDSEEMLDIAKNYNVTSLKRPDHFCTDHVPMNDVYEHLAKNVKTDHIAYLHVTSPLLKSSTLDLTIEKYYENLSLNLKYDSLATVETLKKYIWHNFEAVNYDPNHHPRSQDLPEYYALNFAVNIISTKNMILRKNIVGNCFYPFILDEIESIDVDTEHDFEIAEIMYKRITESNF